jgi:hypothetical protein
MYQEDCDRLQDIDNIYCELLFLQGKGVTQDLTEDTLQTQADLLERLNHSWDRVTSYNLLQQQPGGTSGIGSGVLGSVVCLPPGLLFASSPG